MIPQRDLSWQTQSWQEQMMNSVLSASRLLEILQIDPLDIELSDKAAAKFPVLAPHSLITRMTPKDTNDPLLKQVLSTISEETIPAGYSADPLKEAEYNPVKGLIRKYRNRALLIVTSKCAINCRYCFRREFPYEQNNPSREDWRDAFKYLEEQKEIDEVILSGGDPLSVPDRHLEWLIKSLSEIKSVRRLRIHTRLPIVIPDRVTSDLLQIIRESRFSTTVVVHANHANEFDKRVSAAMHRLKTVSKFVLNQSVLLKGVNDNLDSQVNLQKACVDAGVLPYYLHFLDPVLGASHFEVPHKKALELYKQMQAALSGYMLPKLVIERAGAPSKQFLQ